MSTPYSYCPTCQQPANARTRGIPTYDLCANGHRWLVSDGLRPQKDAKKGDALISCVAIRGIMRHHLYGEGWSDVQLIINEGQPSERMASFEAPDEVALLLLRVSKEQANP